MRSSHQTSVKVRSVPCHCIDTHASDALRRPLRSVPIATARAPRLLTISSEDKLSHLETSFLIWRQAFSSEDKLSLGWQWDVVHVLWAD